MSNIEITTDAAILRLEKIRDRLEGFKTAIKRKRSWRQSEMAMMMLEYEYEIIAINMAIRALKN